MIGGPTPAPPGVDQLVAAQISWGGFANGQIPYDAMRYSPHSAYMHPAASAAWDQLYAAALAEGFDLRGAGYRPASAGGHTAGNSNHGWGLAIDVSVLVPGAQLRHRGRGVRLTRVPLAAGQRPGVRVHQPGLRQAGQPRRYRARRLAR